MKIEFWADRQQGILNPKIFSEDAEKLSQTLASQEGNKRTQIRRFYDEVLRLDQDAKRAETKWENVLARLHLLIPKAVYALGRKLVSKDFVDFIKNSVKQIHAKEDLAVFATFFEAFMGFYRFHQQKD